MLRAGEVMTIEKLVIGAVVHALLARCLCYQVLMSTRS